MWVTTIDLACMCMHVHVHVNSLKSVIVPFPINLKIRCGYAYVCVSCAKSADSLKYSLAALEQCNISDPWARNGRGRFFVLH